MIDKGELPNTELQDEAFQALNKLQEAIEKRRSAETEVSKAHKNVALVRVKNAATSSEVDRALSDFSELAAHW